MRVFAILVLVFSFSSATNAQAPTKHDAQPPAAGTTVSADQTQDEPTSFWMQKKMDHAQEILRGLASADFATIGDAARHLGRLNKVEGFIRKRNPEYRAQVQTFQRVCNEMIRQADNRNLPGVTLAFNQLTISCVNCHQTLRTPEIIGSAVQKTDTTKASEQ